MTRRDALARLGSTAVGLVAVPRANARPAIELAHWYRLRSCSFVRGGVEQVGLLACTTSLKEEARLGADLVDRILRGARPAELPVRQVDVVDLPSSRRSAKALGITPSQAMLLRASVVMG